MLGNTLVRTIATRTPLLVSAIILLSAGLATAQQEARVPEESTSWGSWICAVVFTGLVAAIALKNPKRTHLG